MLLPSKVKFRKTHKGRRRNTGVSTRRTTVDFGSVGIKALEYGWITSRQIEAARRAIMHHIKKGGKVWIRIFPDKSVTTHGNENTMGGGKGAVDYYVAVVRPGTVLFELDGVTEDIAKEALRRAGHKLPVMTKFVKKI